MAGTKNSVITKIQTWLSITKSEAVIVLVLLAGLIIGSAARYVGFSGKSESVPGDEVYRILDSLAELNKTSFTGTDIKNNPIEELAAKDTLLKKNSAFTTSKKLSGTDEKINLNKASKVQLMKLPGVGEKTAVNIIEYRKTKAFRKAEDIMNIRGIGAKKFEKMEPYIEVK